MCRTILRAVTLTAATLFFLFISLPAFSDSQVRIVRLSYIEGGVQIDRGLGFDKAMVNLPISQGTWLRTGDDGRAEVEFEDGSALRMTPNTTVEFPQLSLRDSGEKVSTVNLKQGIAYVDFAGNRDNAFTLQVGQQKVALSHAVRLRVGVADDKAAIALIKGEAQIDGASGAVLLKKGQTASFDLGNNDSYTLAKNIQHEPYDDWDKHQSEYRLRYASNSYNSYSPYAYGTADMSYYGNFFNVPGYGMMWRPYFAGTGWDPFMNGAWAFSPGFGFGWVSSYPWGWTPYHYGTWAFVPGYGWAWQPGGAWTPWYAQPRIMNPPSGFSAPQAPRGGTSTMVVNRGPISVPSTQSGGRLVIRNDSAGLGIRRGEINNLAKVSRQVEQNGVVAAPVRTSTMLGQMPTSAQRGSAAGPSSASSSQRGPQTMSRGSSGGGPSAPMSRSSAPASSPGPSGGGGSHRGR